VILDMRLLQEFGELCYWESGSTGTDSLSNRGKCEVWRGDNCMDASSCLDCRKENIHSLDQMESAGTDVKIASYEGGELQEMNVLTSKTSDLVAIVEER